MQSFMIALLTCSVTMSVLALFYMAITPLLSKRYSAKGRYYTWLIVVIALIIPFRPQFDNAVVKVDVPLEMALPIGQLGNGTPVVGPAPTASLPAIASSISIWQILMIVWLAGAVFSLVYHAIKHYRFVKLVGRWSENVKDEKIISALDRLKAEMGISKSVGVQLCASAGSPMMIGFLHPQILLPQIDFAPDELHFILAHELVHYKRKDLWYKALTLLATAIHWFNPIVYLVAKAIDIQCELSCDNEVIRQTDAETRQHYSEAIIGVVRYQSKMKTALSTNFYGGKKGMKKRIFSIMDTGRKKVGAVILCGALLLTLGTGFAFAVNAAAATPQSGNTPAPTAEDVAQQFAIYEEYGLSYDVATDCLYYNGELVRYFEDYYQIDNNSYAGPDYFNENGTVDIHGVRDLSNIVRNADGSYDPSGTLLGIEPYSQAEFEARDIDELKNPSQPATANNDPNENVSGSQGRTIAQIFGDYEDYGITYVENSANKATGNVYYQGQLVATFVDEKPNGGMFTFSSMDGGNITVRTVYDASGNLTGVNVDN